MGWNIKSKRACVRRPGCLAWWLGANPNRLLAAWMQRAGLCLRAISQVINGHNDCNSRGKRKSVGCSYKCTNIVIHTQRRLSSKRPRHIFYYGSWTQLYHLANLTKMQCLQLSKCEEIKETHEQIFWPFTLSTCPFLNTNTQIKRPHLHNLKHRLQCFSYKYRFKNTHTHTHTH